MRFTKNLLAAAVLAVAAAPAVYAQTYSGYNVVITAATPKGSAADKLTAAGKKATPTSTKFTPCLAVADTMSTGTIDQMTFTLKYEAGSATDSATVKNLYLLLTPPNATAIGNVFSITRDDTNLINTPIAIGLFGAATTLGTKAYTLAENNPGGSQTEVVFGGAIPLEGLSTGLWTLTAVIGDSADLNSTPGALGGATSWEAWDSVSFLVGSPFPGGSPANCS